MYTKPSLAIIKKHVVLFIIMRICDDVTNIRFIYTNNGQAVCVFRETIDFNNNLV